MEWFMFYLKVYSFIEIKMLMLIEYIRDLYYSDYYKIVIFDNNKITNQYINKDLQGIDISNKTFDLVVFEDNRKCILIDNQNEYSNFTMSYLIKKCAMPHQKDILLNICNFTFSLIVIYINEKEYEIKLKNFYYNFYIVGNKINNNFIKYFAYKYLQIKEPILNYEMVIIDNECKFIDNISNKDTIFLYENKYELK
jgi:hypothetical protein